MTIRDILVPLAPSIDLGPQLDAAARLAKVFGARINVVLSRPESVMAAANVQDMLVAAGVAIDAIEQETKLAETSAIAQFEHWRVANGLSDAGHDPTRSAASAVWHERIGSVIDTISQVGKVSDLVIIGQPDPCEAITDEMFKTAIYSTGRPIIIVPGQPIDEPLDHILIAWNGSVQAARAVAAAMPMLKAARRVSIFTVPEKPEALYHHLGLIEHLDQHGIGAEWAEPSVRSTDLGFRLAETAGLAKATMIVMGAYTHHRIHEVFLGGVTQHMSKHAEIPVLMMH